MVIAGTSKDDLCIAGTQHQVRAVDHLKEECEAIRGEGADNGCPETRGLATSADLGSMLIDRQIQHVQFYK